MRDGLDRLGRPAAQRVDDDHVAAADVREQRPDRRLLRRDRDIDRAGVHQVDVGGAVDQGHDLARTQALGQHRRQDVGLVVVGHRAEDVGVLDVLLQQQVLVGGVAP
jgi:hypothetical protein